MILSCNSCNKKFVVPDSAIVASGRLVQCSACGNKWTQFPINNKTTQLKKTTEIKSITKKIKSSPKKVKSKTQKKSGPNLYSPEYLAKKHGIRIQNTSLKEDKVKKVKDNVSFGFYNYLIVFSVSLISVLKLIHFAQHYIIIKVPMTEVYLEYLFETIRNLIDIIKNFLTIY